MSRRIRGQEITIRLAVDGALQEGSWFKVPEFTYTVRSDIVEEPFLGELEDDLDFQHHGFDFSFSVQNQDQKTLEFLSLIIAREQDRGPHPRITLTVFNAYRGEPGASDQAEVFHDVVLRYAEQGFGGRKEYVTTQFEGKCKRRSLVPTAA